MNDNLSSPHWQRNADGEKLRTEKADFGITKICKEITKARILEQ